MLNLQFHKYYTRAQRYNYSVAYGICFYLELQRQNFHAARNPVGKNIQVRTCIHCKVFYKRCHWRVGGPVQFEITILFIIMFFYWRCVIYFLYIIYYRISYVLHLDGSFGSCTQKINGDSCNRADFF